MNILYVTTFNKVLFEKTGKNLLDSYLNKVTIGDFLVCYEDFDYDNDSNKIIKYDLKNDKYMNDWLENNKNIIPKMYDGDADDDSDIFIDKNVDPISGEKGQYWAKLRASRYFRKVVALNYAINKYSEKYDYIFFIDSDCIFKKDFDYNLINKLFINDVSMVYFWGKFRKSINRGPETGFTGYSKKNNGFNFIKIISDCFESKKFLNYDYWDDGYVIGKLIDENKDKFNLKDLVEGTNKKTTRVMEIQQIIKPNIIFPNLIFDYIHHFKNTHKTSI